MSRRWPWGGEPHTRLSAVASRRGGGVKSDVVGSEIQYSSILLKCRKLQRSRDNAIPNLAIGARGDP
jgi:hypothetical protein